MHDDLLLLDNIRLNFSPASLHIMNICIGFIMFGVALGIKWDQMRDIILNPRKVIIGLASQFLVLPAVTFLAVILLGSYITPAVAFGMLLVASCPGGNVSNFISSVAKANVPLSISLTASGTVLAVLFTPLNFAFWGGLYSATSPYLRPIEIDPLDMFRTVVILLGIPVAVGILFSHKLPVLTEKIKKPISRISMFVFIAFLIMAFRNNYEYFVEYINWIFIIVLLHNGLALFSGYVFPWFFGLDRNDRRTIAIETGIQNSGLGLVLLFNPRIFPPDLQMGGMAFIAAWWGIWHIISGLGLATFWGSVRKVEKLA
ncbi:MAG TPA: bile acid:sodium symporter family protein [Lentimicrobium sp.]|nr:bile acid:sodium symporter family protein [Lentimicrobium sp.]